MQTAQTKPEGAFVDRPAVVARPAVVDRPADADWPPTAHRPLLTLGGRPIGSVLRVLGPAWIVMLADVDAASVVTAAKAGSEFGYAMLLPLALLVPILYLVQELTARLAIGTGLGHAELIRRRYGFGWGAIAVGSMVLIDLLAYVAEFAGIVLGASIVGIPALPAVVAALVVHSVMVLTGSYQRFERMAIVMSLALFSFVIVAIAAGPSPTAVLGGFAPRNQPLGEPGYLDLVVATIGAVIMPWMLFYQQAATVDKGLAPEDLPAARGETLVGAIASEVLMGVVVVAAAAATATSAAAAGSALSGGGISLPAGLTALAVDGFAIWVAIGMIGSGLLAAVVISLSSAWAWAELFHWPHSLNLSPRRAPAFYALYLLEVVPAAIVALVAQDLVSVVIDAMILNVVVLAVPLTFLVRLSSDASVLGPLVNSHRHALVLWAITAGLLVLGLISLAGLLGT